MPERGLFVSRQIMRKGNIYSDIPERMPEEFFETLAISDKVRVERIVSDSHSSPEGFWYDQKENEWVMVVRGGAALRFEGEEELVVLKEGDWVRISAHVRHRVEWTNAGEKTVWLAVFY
jgi:cupin 2 domain-containing protein